MTLAVSLFDQQRATTSLPTFKLVILFLHLSTTLLFVKFGRAVACFLNEHIPQRGSVLGRGRR